MIDRPVFRSGKDAHHNITQLCGDWGTVSSINAIAQIEMNIYNYYVPLTDGTRATIEVVDGATGKYLRTNWDGTTKNNLDDLQDC